jgi:hypothetical protein
MLKAGEVVELLMLAHGEPPSGCAALLTAEACLSSAAAHRKLLPKRRGCGSRYAREESAGGCYQHARDRGVCLGGKRFEELWCEAQRVGALRLHVSIYVRLASCTNQAALDQLRHARSCEFDGGRRGRSTKLWYWLGAIFGPFAVLAVALLPPASEHTGRPPGGLPQEPALSGRRAPRRTSDQSHRLDIVVAPVA